MLHFCIEQLGKVQRKEQNLKIWYCVAFKVPENAKKGTALLSSQCVQLEIKEECVLDVSLKPGNAFVVFL